MENGCCEFDLETLSPTYRLLIGLPGKSNAFAISKRLGLPDYIIEQAKSQLDVSAIDYENMLAELEKNKAEIEKEQAELYSTRQEIDRLKNELKEKQDDIKEKRAELLRQAREEAHNILSEAKEVADESIRKYNAWAQHPGQNNTKKMEASEAISGAACPSWKNSCLQGQEGQTYPSAGRLQGGATRYLSPLFL